MAQLPGVDERIPLVDLPQISDLEWQLAATLQQRGIDPFYGQEPLSFDQFCQMLVGRNWATAEQKASTLVASHTEKLITTDDAFRLLDQVIGGES